MKIIIANLLFVLFLTACGAPEPAVIEETTPEPTEEVVEEEDEVEEEEEQVEVDPTPDVTEKDPSAEHTTSQENAIRSAKNYLSFMHFSREGLIQQLEFDDYTTEDAEYAVDSLEIDYMEQAAGAAKDYLDFTGFSRSGLITQLEFDGFTTEQAEHGADSVDL